MPQVRTRQRAQKSKYFENHSDSDLSAASSGDEFIPAPKIKPTSRRSARKSKVSRNSKESTETLPKVTKKSAPITKNKVKHKVGFLEQISSASDTSDEDGFEEVPNPPSDDDVKAPISTQREIEFMGQLLTKAEEKLTDVNDEKEIKVSVSTVKTKSIIRDPEVLVAMAEARELRQRARFVHSFHVMGFLTLGRFVNRLCDDPLIRALGLSLINESRVKGVSSLRSLVLSFLSLITASRGAKILDVKEGIQTRLKSGCSSSDDCCILMVAGLRALGFDTRLVLAFAPPALKPSKIKPIKTLKPLKERRSNKIISSDSEGDIQGDSKYVIFAEVYLPADQIWYCLELSPPVGKVTAEFSSSPFHYPYVVGFTSTEKSYLGRSPIDLAPRYDPTWMSTSRSNRIPSAQYQQFLSSMRYHCDGDVVELRERDDTKAEERRDAADIERTFDHLRSLPIPSRVQDLKNHPLYVLRRHLLKFEVIYPDDAPVVGFFKVGAKGNECTESVYPRECVYLCHTRESWLKEAKVVRVGEKPAKIVKAMMTMKRKLLQDQDGTQSMVELFGPWQVDDYVPPVAETGIVPRNEHGNVELFKASMLPVGCVHIRLPGIQHIAKQLQIDFAPAMVGWSFGKAGWAHPEYDGFVVCKEVLPALLDAWRAARMNAKAAEAADRSERALANWKRLTKHLLLWQRVEERFQLAKSAHVRPRLVSVGDIKMGTKFGSGEPGSSGWKPLVSANPVFPRLLDVTDLAKPSQQSITRPNRGAANTAVSKTPVASRRLRKRKRLPSVESESSDLESEVDNFIDDESEKFSAPKRPRKRQRNRLKQSEGSDKESEHCHCLEVDSKLSSAPKRSRKRQIPSVKSGDNEKGSEHDDFINTKSKKLSAHKQPSTRLEHEDFIEVESKKSSVPLKSQQPSGESENDSDESDHNDFLQ